MKKNRKKLLSDVRLKLQNISNFNLFDYVLTQRSSKSKLEWLGFLDKSLLFGGVLFVISGLIFFFAYNWKSMHHLMKLGLILFFIASSLLIQVRENLTDNVKSALIFTSLFLIGVFLAVFGQSYQTGANSWNLFFGWTFLALPLVLIHNEKTSYFFILGLANLTITFFMQQHFESQVLYRSNLLSLALLGFNVLSSITVLLFERKLHQMSWLQIVLLSFLILQTFSICFNSIIKNQNLINHSLSFILWLTIIAIIILLCYYCFIFRFNRLLSSIILWGVVILLLAFLVKKSKFALESFWIASLLLLLGSYLNTKLVMYLDNRFKEKNNAAI